jgi:hypothetical protein
MTGLLVLSALDPATLAWLPAVLAAGSGMVLHIVLPPLHPSVAEALLVATVHP